MSSESDLAARLEPARQKGYEPSNAPGVFLKTQYKSRSMTPLFRAMTNHFLRVRRCHVRGRENVLLCPEKCLVVRKV